MYILDPSTGNWKQWMNIPAARSGAAVINVNDKIVIIGEVIDLTRELSNVVWIGMVE